MNCWRTRQLLSAFLDGELSPAEAAQLEEHLTSCTECDGARNRLAALPPLDLPRLDAAVEDELWSRMDDALDKAWEQHKERSSDRFAVNAWDAMRRWLRAGRVAVPVPVAAAYMVLILGLTCWTLHTHYKIQDLSAALQDDIEDRVQARGAAAAAPMLHSRMPRGFSASVSQPLAIDRNRDDDGDDESPPLMVPVIDSTTGAIVYSVDSGYPLEY
jgi:anti-sigma factor RsiW